VTRDDIIRMAREAGFPVSKWDDGVDEVMDGDNYHIQTDLIECFAALVAAAEREACAKVAERYEPDEKTSYVTYASSAIRARGEK
jgi:hypothetical protein